MAVWHEGPAVNFVVIGSELCLFSYAPTPSIHPFHLLRRALHLPRTHRDRNTYTSGPHVSPPPRPIPRRPPRRHLKDRSHPRLLQASVRRRPHRILLLCQDSHCRYRQELRKSSTFPSPPPSTNNHKGATSSGPTSGYHKSFGTYKPSTRSE